MRFTIILILGLFCYACGETTASNEFTPEKSIQVEHDTTPRVTGIGGIFIKAKDPKSLQAWYGEKLGLKLDPYGSAFEFRNANDASQINYLRWGMFPDSTEYFTPSEKEFMINYRVHRLEALLDKLRDEGVTILDSVAAYDYGKFVHILDPDGNKIELWEPVDSVLTALGGPTTK